MSIDLNRDDCVIKVDLHKCKKKVGGE
uniref:Uncharacterized protein n=1 Tax=Tetranychus urticae TaxID=32264 RepID=T1JQL9_TETUR